MFCCSCLLRAAALLIKAAQQWRREHDGQLPGSYAERSAFKDLLKSWQRQIDGIPLEVGGLAGAALAGAAASGCHTKRRHACAAGVLPEQCPLQASICGGPAGRHAALAPACFKQLPPSPPPRRRRTSQRRWPTRTRCGRRPASPPSCGPSWRTAVRRTSRSRWGRLRRRAAAEVMLAAGAGQPMDGGAAALEESAFQQRMPSEVLLGLHPSCGPPCLVAQLLTGQGAASLLNPLPQSPNFWVLVAALKLFIEREGQGQLPLEVSAPPRGSTRARVVLCLPACSASRLGPRQRRSATRLMLPRQRLGSRREGASLLGQPAVLPPHPCPSLLSPAGQHTRHACLHPAVPAAAAHLQGKGGCR